MVILLAFAQSVCTARNDTGIVPVNPIVSIVNKCSVYADTAITAHSVSMIANANLVNVSI